MRKMIAAVFAVLLILSLAGCVNNPGQAVTKLNEGEMMLTGKVTKVSSNLMTFETEESSISDKFYIGYSDSVTVVEDGEYVVDCAAYYFKGKRINVICSELVEETYPAGLTAVRMIIIQ